MGVKKMLVEGSIKEAYEKAEAEGRVIKSEYGEIIPDEFNAFHCKGLLIVVRNDDYFCGMRADHFVVELGEVEGEEGRWALITCNHKGVRLSRLFPLT